MDVKVWYEDVSGITLDPSVMKQFFSVLEDNKQK